MNNVKRIEWIDIAKGIGIILVVYGHIHYVPETMNAWLCSFHMPLFFFLSGINFNDNKYINDFSSFIKNKFCSLIVPYFMFSIVMYVYKIVRYMLESYSGSVDTLKQFAKWAMAIVIQIRTTDYGIGIWFIPCMFISFVLFYVIIKVAKGKKSVVLVLSTVLLLVGYLYCEYIDIKLPWGIDAAFIAVFFVALGYLFKGKLNKEITISGQTILMGAIALIINIVFAYLNNKVLGRTVGMWSNNYGNLLFFLIAAIMGIVFVVILSNIVRFKFVRKIGKNSIYFYGLHVVLIELMDILVEHFVKETGTIMNFLISTVIMIVVVLILYLGIDIYNVVYNKAVKRVKGIM